MVRTDICGRTFDDSLSKHLLEGVEVHYGTQIDSISGYNGHWELNTEKGDFGF